MATLNYMAGRKKYNRPQALLFSDNPGTLVTSPTAEDPDKKVYVPIGYEIGANSGSETNQDMLNTFLILSDDNRSPIDISHDRIEKRERMINGRMRSYHIADKMNISMSWDNLPSRAFALNPDFSSSGVSDYSNTAGLPNMAQANYTTDGGAGGVELLDWYKNHKGSFWVFLAYDKYSNFGKNDNAYLHKQQYNELVEVFFSNFDYSIVKRGANIDLWKVSLTLEEV